MAVDERARHALYERLTEVLGMDEADTLVGYLPPVGWADVATKRDLDHLEERMDAKFAALEERMDAKFTALEERMDAKFTALEERMDAKSAALEERMDARFAALEERMDARFAALEQRVETGFLAVDQKVDAASARISAALRAELNRTLLIMFTGTLAAIVALVVPLVEMR